MPTDITFENLFEMMLNAAKKSLVSSVKNKWPKVRDLTTSSVKTLAQNLVDISTMKKKGSVTEEQAKLMINIQKNSFKTLLLTEKGIGLLIAEEALNEIIKVVRGVVNKAVGFDLL